MLRHASPLDAREICRLYNHHVRNTHVTFETVEVDADEMSGRINTITSKYPWIVYEDQNEKKIRGYAYATRWKERQAYDHTAECAVYVDEDCSGRGIGTKLYEALITECRASGLHTLIAGIALPNDASIALHEKLGFVYVGTLREVGFKHQQWIDVGYWTLRI